ncbi:MAG TPA: cysteine desulfurase [Methanotrichaceae archaeon]|nr:cysteine desulfurase [Methanotrichaceae archaeon]
MSLEQLRADFPLVNEVAYLDSASTSLTPEPVLEAMMQYYREYRANVGRGVYRLAQVAYQRYRDAHMKVAGFVGCKDDGVLAFTKNSTESINAVARGLDWKRGDRVVTTVTEHHSNFLPWLRLRSLGVDLEVIEPGPGPECILDLSSFSDAITTGTKLVAVAQVSNVLGTILPVKEIADICHDRGAMLLVDGAQSVPHIPTDIPSMKCDFLCFSGHKMLGPTGTGVLWTGKEIEPLMLGGGMVEDVSLNGYVPKTGYERLEAGTPDIAGGIGLGRAVDYLSRAGMGDVRDHEARLTARLLQGLMEIEGVEIYGPADLKHRSGVVSFNVRGMKPQEVALMLDEAANIMVRSGHHCCIPLMKYLGLKEGTVRASVYLYNTEDEIEKLLGAVEEIAALA